MNKIYTPGFYSRIRSIRVARCGEVCGGVSSALLEKGDVLSSE